MRSAFLRLSPEHREVLLAASVIGPVFSIRQLAAIARLPRARVLDALQRALEARLVMDPGDGETLVFRGNAYALVAGSLLSSRARSFQARIARDLENGPADPEQVAERWRAAGELGKMSRAYERAGDARALAGDFRGAARNFRAALTDEVRESDAVRLREKIGNAANRSGHSNDAVEILRRQLASLQQGPPGELSLTLLELSRSLWTVCDADEAIEMAERVFAVRRAPPALVDETRAWLAYLNAVANRLEVAERHLASARRNRAKLQPVLQAAVEEVEFVIAAKRGDLAAVRAAYERAVSAAGAAGRVTLTRVVNNFVFESGPLQRAPDVEAALLLLGADEGAGGRVNLNLRLSLAEWALLHGELTRASECIDAISELDGNGPRHVALRAGLRRTIATLLGDRSPGETPDPATLDAVLRSREPRLIAPVIAPYCETLVRASRVAEAQALVERALGAPADAPFGIELLAARVGTLPQIKSARGALVASTKIRKDHLARATLLLFDAIVAARSGQTAAPRHARNAALAAEEFRRAGWRLHEAEALEYAGRPRQAAEVYREVGAYSELRRLRVTTRRPRSTGKRGLTARQRQVCRLVSGGASNAAVAAQLALSEKTVAHHLSAAYERLGIRSRWQLRAALESAR
jgi:DNA-binding CsgD family transcriptional regulator